MQATLPPPPTMDAVIGDDGPRPAIHTDKFVEQVSAWAALGLPYWDIIQAAKNRWEIRIEDEFPLLHLAVLLVLGARHMVAQGLVEAALLRLQQDPFGSSVLQGLLEDLVQILR